MVVATGNYGRLAFGYESDFGSGGTANLDFGYNAKLSGNNIGRNVRMLYNIGSPFAKKPVALQFDGTFGVAGVLTNDNLFEAIFGKGSKQSSDSNGDGVTDTNTYTPQYHPQSLYVEYGYSGNKNILVGLKGCLIRGASINARVNEPISYRISCIYQKPVKSNPTSIEPVNPPSEQDAFTFIGSDLTFMGQKFIVQDFSVNFDLGSNNIYGLGSAFAQDMYRGILQISGSCTVLAQSDEILDLLLSLGKSTSSTSEMADDSSMDENQTAELILNVSDGRSLEVDLSGVVINKIGQDLEAGQMVLYSVDFNAMIANATYKF